jgi:hypothetical protein
MKKRVLLSSVLAGILFFSGCGSTGEEVANDVISNNTNETSEVSGVVADGYIIGSIVFADLNKNGLLDNDEPHTITDKNGKYTLKYDGNLSGVKLVTVKGFDENRKVYFNSSLVSVVNSNNTNLTPITTFNYSYAEEKGISFEEAMNSVSSILGISKDDINSDPVQNNDLEIVSLNLQLTAEIVSNFLGEKPLNVYKELAKNASSDKNLTEIIENSFDSNVSNVVKTILAKVPEYVNNNKISQIEAFKNELVNYAKNLMNKGISITADILNNYLKYKEELANLNLNEDVIKNDLNGSINYIKNLASLKVASITDAKNTFSVIRDSIYEFINPNINDEKMQDDSTIVGEVVHKYDNAIEPSLQNVSDHLTDSINKINSTINKYNEDLKNDFNVSLNNLGDRLDAIANGIKEYSHLEDYNFTTSFGDEIKHTYTQDSDGISTEVYTINDINLTATYKDTLSSATFETSGVLSFYKENEYDVKLNSLSFNGTRLEFNLSGTVYGNNNSSIIKAKEISLGIDINESILLSNNSLKAFNINYMKNVEINTTNGSFVGTLKKTGNILSLLGILDYKNYSNVYLKGKINLNIAENDLRNIINDLSSTPDYDFYRYFTSNIFTVNDNLVTKIDYKFNGCDTDDNGIETCTRELNLTSFANDFANCKITDIYKERDHSHIVDCGDTNVSGYVLGDKIVSADFDNKLANLENVCINREILNSDNSNTIFLKYDFFAGYSNIEDFINDTPLEYKIFVNENNESVITLNGKEIDVNVTNLTVRKVSDLSNVVADVTFDGDVEVNNDKISLKLSAISNGNGTYSINANDLIINTLNLEGNISSIKLDWSEKKGTEFSYLDTYTSADERSDENNVTLVTIENFNANLVDINGEELQIKDLNLSYDSQNYLKLSGVISYADLYLDGSFNRNMINNTLLMNIDVERNGYSPFVLGVYGEDNNGSLVNFNALISRQSYGIGIIGTYDRMQKASFVDIFDTNGVFVKIKDTEVNITDKDGNPLATFDPETNTINYADGSSETLY